MPVYENERGTYIFNSKDLNMIEYIDQILDAGIDSFKIEGRMKTALYVATVARTYRKAIDDCKESVEKYRANMDYYKEEIAKCTYRQFTTGFYFGKTDETSQIYRKIYGSIGRQIISLFCNDRISWNAPFIIYRSDHYYCKRIYH